ncbi:MAG: lipid A biosynthesis acyltransferase [Oxalobacter sp.]|nr:lipid A biosynthesis acyltransferase [Oxalobacter sp.]
MRFFLFILWAIHWLPLPILGRMGKLLGTCAYHFWARRRRITLTNLRLCFPDMPESERERIALEHFQGYGRSILERGILWWSSVDRIKRLIQVEPEIPYNLTNAGPVILLCPHFVCLEMPGAIFSMGAPCCSIYTEQKNKIFDKVLHKGRVRFNPGVEIYSRSQGIKPIIRGIHKGLPFLMLPDMDFGIKDAEFVPFFGVPAATLVATSRIAAATRAKVIPVIGSFLPDYKGWKVTFYPPLENFPTKDVYADTKRINEFIEQRILERPAEYLWTHRRFKTRPEGMPPVYGKDSKK